MFPAYKTLSAASLILALTACGGKTADEHVQSAKNYIAQGQIEAAVIELKNAIVQEESVDSRLMLGNIYLELGQLNLAQKEFESALVSGAKPVLVYPVLAKALYLQDNSEAVLNLEYQTLTDEALSAVRFYQGLAHLRTSDVAKFEAIVTEQNNQSNKYQALLNAYQVSNQDQSRALELASDIAQQYPKFTDPLILIGHLATNTDQYEQAISAYQKHLKLMPNYIQARLFLANALVKAERFEQAEKETDALLSAYPQLPIAHQFKAIIKFDNKAFDDAYLHIEKAIQGGLDTDSNKLIAGLSAFRLDKTEQAHKYLDVLKDKLAPQHPALRVLAVAKLQLGYTQEAAQTISNFDTIKNNDVKILTSTSYELIKSGELEQASEILAKSTADDVNSAIDNVQQGVLKLSLKDVSGIVNLEKAIEIDPSLPVAKASLATAYLITKEYDKALELAKSWQQQQDVAGYNLAATVYLNQEKQDAARAAFNQALEIDPNNPASLVYFAEQSLKDKDAAKSKALIEQLLKAYPDNLIGLRALYIIEKSQNNVSTAIDKMRQSFERNQNSLRFRTQLVQFYLAEQNTEATIELIEPLVEDKSVPLDDFLWLTLTDAYVAKKDQNKLSSLYTTWTKRLPQSKLAIVKKAYFDMLTKDPEAALATIRTGITKNSDNIELKMLEVYYLIKSDKLSLAQKNLDNNLAELKQTPNVKGLQGQIWFKQKHFAKAMPMLEAQYQAKPSSEFARQIYMSLIKSKQTNRADDFINSHLTNYPVDALSALMAASYNLEIDQDKAIKHYHHALKADKNNIIALNNIAWLYQQKTDLAKATNFIEQALEQAPNNVQVLDTAATIFEQKGQLTKAKSLISKAYELDKSQAIEANYNRIMSTN